MKTTKATAKTASNTMAVVGDDEFRIEDGVPMPTTARPARAVRYFPFEKLLKSGQSFLVTKDRKKGLRPALKAHYAAHPTERKSIIIRPVEGEALRVWRK
jgi:hypothetical protein